MKKSLFALAIFGTGFTANAQNHGMLTGDKKLACEAVLCLSTGQRPDECAPSIKKYFSISRKKWSDTVKDRRKFLDKCPSVNEDNTMKQLANAVSEGAGKCDVANLNNLRSYAWDPNTETTKMIISNKMPNYCGAYWNHAYTDLDATVPVYVGDPARGGFWVEPAQYQQALEKYNARIAQENAAATRKNIFN
ncbi:MAG: conjugal transfer protein TrbM [Azoarcus sp.]|jgi:hypothetical protein|nr:conjugal transfer protein TrbM [Azoarcus sp.]